MKLSKKIFKNTKLVILSPVIVVYLGLFCVCEGIRWFFDGVVEILNPDKNSFAKWITWVVTEWKQK